jgi:ArsR family transcriptional regulator
MPPLDPTGKHSLRGVMPLPRPIPESLREPIARQLQVLGQPIRIRLVDRLDLDGELSVGAIAANLDITSYNASQQLGVLRRAGVVSRGQRGREGVYALADEQAIGVYELVWASMDEERRHRGRRLGSSE